MNHIHIKTADGGTHGEIKQDPDLESWELGDFAYNLRLESGDEIYLRDQLLEVVYVCHDIARNRQNVTVGWFPEADWKEAE